MKKIILITVLALLVSVVYAADPVILIDKTGKEVNPGASNRWPVVHLNAATAGVKMLLSAPGNTKSHYVTGFIMSGGADADGFHFLRQNCVVFDAAADTLTMADDGTDFDWGTQAADGDFSAEFWINYEATAAAAPSLMKRGNEASDGWLIELTAASLVKFTAHDSSDTATITATTAIDDGEWHHIVVSVDRDSTTGMQIYVDGQADATAVDPTDMALTLDGGTTIVMTGVNNETFYISTAGIYIGSDAFLSASEVTTRYNAGIGLKYEGDETGLVVGFNTDEGESTACHDIKNDASNVITLSGTSWAPSRQNGATAEVNVDGIPINEQDMTVAVGKFHCGVGSAFGGFPVIFPHPIKIGRNCPLNILETNGAFSLIVFGYTTTVR
jgi:hypothetical protein